MAGLSHGARNYGKDDYSYKDSLISAGFGGVINGALGRVFSKAPKNTKQVNTSSEVNKTNNIQDIQTQNINKEEINKKDDEIARKLFEEHFKSDKPNFEMVGNAKTIYPKSNNPKYQQVPVKDGIYANMNKLSNKRIDKLDDNIKYYDTPQKMEYLVNKALENPTHKLKATHDRYNLIINANHKNNPSIVIDETGKQKKWVKSGHYLRDKQVENKVKKASTSLPVASQTVVSEVKPFNKNIIPNNTVKSQDDGKLNIAKLERLRDYILSSRNDVSFNSVVNPNRFKALVKSLKENGKIKGRTKEQEEGFKQAYEELQGLYKEFEPQINELYGDINKAKTLDDALYENMDYETANKEGLIPFANGQTLGGAFAGGGESEFNQRDYTGDKKHDYKDNLVGALIGAVGIATAKKLVPKLFEDSNIDKNSVGMFVGAKPNAKGVYPKGSFSDIATKKTMSEIDDSLAKVKAFSKDGSSVKLNEVLDHPKLFEQYPELKNINVRLDNKTYFDKGNNTIGLGKERTQSYESPYRQKLESLQDILEKKADKLDEEGKFTDAMDMLFDKRDRKLSNRYNPLIKADERANKDKLMPDKSSLLHEIQHSIQNKENWARGGNPNSARQTLYDTLDDFIDKGVLDYERSLNHLKEAIKSKDIKEIAYWKKDFDSVRHLKKDYDKFMQYRKLVNEKGKNLYARLWGEQQARATQHRMNMTPKQRLSESWTDSLKKAEGRYDEPLMRYGNDVSYSLDEDTNSFFSKAIDDFTSGKKLQHQYIPMGTTPKVFKDIGLPDTKILMNSKVIQKVTQDKHNITAKQLKQIPKEINNPIAIMKSSPNSTNPNGYVVLTSLKENVKGKDLPIIGALHLKNTKNGLEVINVASVYGKNLKGLQNDINNALYVDKQKWAIFNKAFGLQLPSKIAHTKNIPNDGSISNNNVKSQGLENNSIQINSSPAISGGVVGGASGLNIDYNQDGKNDLTDILIGAGLGAGGTKLANSNIKQIKSVKDVTSDYIMKKFNDSRVANLMFDTKLAKRKMYHKYRDELFSNKNVKDSDYEILHEQLKLLNESTRRDMYKYMNGDKDVQLVPNVKKFADNYINTIDNTSKDLVNLGILSDESFNKFKGRYLRRLYTSKLQLGKGSNGRRGKTIDTIHERGNIWTGTKKEYKQLLKERKIGEFFEGKIEAERLKNGQYRFKQDWSKEQREKWGEIDDIAYVLPETLRRMNQLKQHGTFLKQIANRSPYVLDEETEGFVRATGKKYGLLKDKYIPAEIKNDIDEITESIVGIDSTLKQDFRNFSTIWKKSKTIYNPSSHINNLFGNISIMFMAGVNPKKAVQGAVQGKKASNKLAILNMLKAKKLVGLSKEEELEYKALSLDDDVRLYEQAKKMGLFGRSRLNDVLNKYIKNDTKVASNGLKKIDEKVTSWYQDEDDIMRFSLLKVYMNDGMKLQQAIRKVNNTIPDYTKPMSVGARLSRNTMILPFVSWTYHSTPILFRQMKERPLRALGLLGAFYGINQGLGGVNPLDEKQMPQRNFSMKRIAVSNDGKIVHTLKMDKWIPHLELTSPADFISNLTSGGLWGSIRDVASNTNTYYGGKISHREGLANYYDRTKYAMQNVAPMPAVAPKIYNLIESILLDEKQRKKRKVIKPRSTTEELLNTLGFNVLSYDKNEQKRKVLSQKVR